MPRPAPPDAPRSERVAAAAPQPRNRARSGRPGTCGLACLLWAAGAAAGSETGTLDWLSGHWCGDDSEELWMHERGGRLLGLNRSLDADGGGFEFLRIERADAGYRYLAQPGGRPAVAFEQTAQSTAGIEFANPQHDFPQRIRYWRSGEALHAEVDGGPGTAVLSYRWTPCLADAVK